MTYVTKIRANPGALITCDFECSLHGYFVAMVPRDASGDPPASIQCTEIVEHEHNCEEPPCSDCGFTTWQCGESAAWCISAPPGRAKAGEVVQGKIDAYPGEHNVMDTRPLADGMPLAEFKARRAKVHQEIAIERMRQLTGRGPKAMR